MKSIRAFTLIELLAVIAIIALIAALATPNVIKMIDNSQKEQILTDAKLMISKAKYKFRVDMDTAPAGMAYYVGDLIDNSEKGYETGSYVQTGMNQGTITYSVYLDNTKCRIGTGSVLVTEEDLNTQGKSLVVCN